MLQWMGGSRRKVTSTRMSTQKRQKHYFEQKRRQQQATGGRKDSEEHNIHGQHAENSRSLDILSFQNLSTVVQQNKSNYPLGNDETEHHALNYQALKCPQSIQCFQANKFTPSGPSEAEEARLSSSYQPGSSYAKTMLVSTSGKDARTFNSDDDKMNHIKMVPGYQELGMMDILGDDEPNLHTGSSLEREAHAAFSIEGVGRVEMETPVHTPVRAPEVHGRNFLHGCSPPSKAMRPADSFNLNSELVNLEFELELHAFFSILPPHVWLLMFRLLLTPAFLVIIDIMDKPKQDLLDTREFSIFDDNDNGFTDLFQNDEPFFHKTERNRHSWDATCRPVTGKILDESAFGSSCNIWMDQEDASDDYYTMDCRSEEFTFQGSYRQKSRTTMRKSKRLGHRDSPELYVKRQNSENFHDSTIPEMTWRSPVHRDHDVGDIDYQPTWSCFKTEDTRDNLSLLSEESCSSSAVGGVSKKGTLNSTEKQTPKSADFGSSENICGENIMHGRVKTCNKLEINQQGDNTNEQGKLTRISNSSRSQPADNSKMTSEKRLKSENGRLFEGAYDPGKTISRHNPYPRTYDTNPSSRLWIEDLFGTSGGTNVHADCSPCCNLTSEEHDSHQRKLEKVTPVSSMLNFSEHCNRGYKPQKSMHGHSFPESELQSITREEDEHSDLPVSEHGKLEHWRERSRCRKSLFSGCGKFIYVADVEDKSSDCKESTTEASKLSSGCRKCTCTPDEEDKSNNCKEFTNGTSKAGENVKETDCLQDEDASPSGATSSIDGNSSHVDAKCQLTAQSSFLHQTGSGANLEEGFGHEERTGSEEKSSIESTCQVMTLDSCVLQLLCIQVLKEASAKVTGKKA
ncbi:uncharacterized protein LOC113752134 [Coffea eugenioides]|uniref:uncharacterized protein LOC113752134 n=1 Tax=Coffea eugenioides TaxID=49369 RepID=UPI000F60670C|nr:uncharacterized protein LOC113752134 [Coffea eugenioides]